MSHWETIWQFNTQNFDITGSVSEETDDPADSFDECCQDAIDAIRNGEMAWFVVRVQVKSKYGAILGEEYLGGCAYKTAEDFFKQHITGAAYAREQRAKGYVCGSYFPDMVRSAIAEARKNAKRLTESLGGVIH